MKLLILSIEFPPGPGGLGTLAYQAALRLSELGWEVRVLTPQDHVDEATRAAFNSEQPFGIQTISHVEPPLWEGLRRLFVALRLIVAMRPDVLLANGLQSVWLGAALSTLTGVPLVAIGSGTEFSGRSRLGQCLNRWAFGYARHRVVVSQYTRGLMANAGIKGVSLLDGEITLVPNGADARRFRPGLEVRALRERLGIGKGPVLLTVGRLSERKAQDVVIRALPAILQERPDLVYVMVGLPTWQQELERLAQELGVRDHVLFTGTVPADELPLYYTLADLFVLVSRRAQDGGVEGYGIVVAEAALCGVPAVVSRGCGLEEAVLEDRTALLVDSDDPDATGAAILRLLGDDDLRQSMGKAARSYVLKTGTWAQRVAVYDRVLRRACGGV
jgi:phosphatidylinositol alpha-1,6-mannosyltransferase